MLRAQVIKTEYKWYDRETGSEVDSTAARLACNACAGETCPVMSEEMPRVLFEAVGETEGNVQQQVWDWLEAAGLELDEVEVVFPLLNAEEVEREIALETHLDALNDPDLGWRLPR